MTTIQEELIKIASNSTSNKKKVGALLLDHDSSIELGPLATGWNYDLDHHAGPCEDKDNNTYDSVIHAEMACINNYKLDYPGLSPTGLKMYITHEPCTSCKAALLRENIAYKVVKKDNEETVKAPEDLVGLTHTLKERGSTYGTFQGNATITQGIMKILVDNAQRPLEQFELEALHMIAHKMSRIVNGQRTKKDNWHDIAGYAKLAEDLTKDQ